MDAAFSGFIQLFGDRVQEVVIYSALMTLMAYCIWRIILRPLTVITRNAWAVLIKRDLGVLEVIPPKQLATQPLNTQNLFAVLQQHFECKSPVSFEMIVPGA